MRNDHFKFRTSDVLLLVIRPTWLSENYFLPASYYQCNDLLIIDFVIAKCDYRIMTKHTYSKLISLLDLT